MKRYIILLLIVVLNPLFSEEYNIYTPELVVSLPANNGYESILVISGYYGGVDGPKSFTITPEGFFLISDTENRRMALFNNQAQLLNDFSSESCLAESLWNDVSGIVEYSRSNTGYFRFDERINTEVRVTFSQIDSSEQILGPPFFLEGCVFVYLKENSILAIDNPSNDFEENKLNILSEEETRALIQTPRFQNAGILIDQNNRIERNGTIVTRNYDVFHNYWRNRHEVDGMDEPNSIFHVSWDLGEISNGIDYIGTDNRRNTYWDVNPYLYVFDENGWLIDLFRYDFQKSKVLPSVHPNGDVYFLDYDEEGVYLYRIPNTWAPFDWQPPSEDVFTNSTATVTANGLRMRDNPATTSSNVVASLDQGTTVEILGQSATEETIGGNTNFWYRIRTSDGLDGWVFGAFLDLNP